MRAGYSGARSSSPPLSLPPEGRDEPRRTRRHRRDARGLPGHGRVRSPTPVSPRLAGADHSAGAGIRGGAADMIANETLEDILAEIAETLKRIPVALEAHNVDIARCGHGGTGLCMSCLRPR